MKKLVLISLMLALSGCQNMANMQSADSSVQGRMQTCLMTEAHAGLQAGTLFNSSVTAKAKELVGTCMKKLALQSAGISAESQTTAENIISNLRMMSGK